MAKVLVVDDSAVDQKLVGGILLSDAILTVEYAANGREAIERIEAAPPDLVVTDLQMPEMDGLELVAAIKADFPHLPVILITAYGSEALAVEALQRGAASYVPKTMIADKLSDTVEQILSSPPNDLEFDPLVSCVTSMDVRLTLDNDNALIDPLVGMVKRVTDELGVCGPNDRIRLGVALEEALLNAMYRGNLQVSFEEMQQERESIVRGAAPSLLQQRHSQSPYCDRRVFVHFQATADEAKIVIRDEGYGFDVDAVIEPGDPSELANQGGRGLVLIRTFMDDVYYNESGNEITMIKRRDAADVRAEEPEPVEV